MGQQFVPSKFYRQVGPALLRNYFEGRRLLGSFDWAILDPGDTAPLRDAVEALPPDKLSAVESDFSLVAELATEGGSLLIHQEVDASGALWTQRLGGMRNDYERAFLVLVEDPRLLEMLVGCGEMDRFAAARRSRRIVGRHLPARRDAASLEALGAAVSDVYRPQGRGRVCHVEFFQRRSPRRLCYFAFPEDFPHTELGYDDRGRFLRQPRRSALETFFVYLPEQGLMELAAAGSLDHKERLAAAFCRVVLGLNDLPPLVDRVPFDLAPLRERGFAFPTDAADNIESVEVRQLRFELPGGGRKRLVVSARSEGPHRHSVYDVLDSVLDRERMPPAALDVSQAVLAMKFRPPGLGRARTLTFEITAPDRCNLKDTWPDAAARDYLSRWGIARA